MQSQSHTHTYTHPTHTLTHTHIHTHTHAHTHTHTHTHTYTPHTHHLWFHYDFTNTPLLLQGSLGIAKGQRVKLVFSMSQYSTLSEECSWTCLESLEVLGYECQSIICHSHPKFLPPLYDIVGKPIAKYNMAGRRSGLVSEARSILSSLPKSPNARRHFGYDASRRPFSYLRYSVFRVFLFRIPYSVFRVLLTPQNTCLTQHHKSHSVWQITSEAWQGRTATATTRASSITSHWAMLGTSQMEVSKWRP